MKDPKNPQENLLAPANLSPTFPGWGLSIAAVIVGLIWAWFTGILLILPVGLVLALFGFEEVLVGSGTGWPWPVENLWSLLANIAPILLAAALIAFFTARYIERDDKTSFRPRRWPLALTAIAAGWIPFIEPSWGILGATWVTGFVLMVVITRYTSVETRKPINWTKTNKTIAIVGVITLAFATVSWGTVNSLHRNGDFSSELTIGHTPITAPSGMREDVLQVDVSNTGPFKVRVLDIKPADTSEVIDTAPPQIKLEPKSITRDTKPSKYIPLRNTVIEPSQNATLQLGVYSSTCIEPQASGSWTIKTVDIRTKTAGYEHTQKLDLGQPIPVECKNTTLR